MTHMEYTVLSYVFVLALLWGYAALLLIEARKNRHSNKAPAAEPLDQR